MNVENKIRELLNKKQLSEENAGPMGAAKGKDTSIPAKTAGDTKNPRQGSSEDATISSERDQETENPGSKEAAPIADNKSKISQSGAGAAPNFTTHSDPTSVVNMASSKGNVHQEEFAKEVPTNNGDKVKSDVHGQGTVIKSTPTHVHVKYGDKTVKHASDELDYSGGKHKWYHPEEYVVGEEMIEEDFTADLATLFDGNEDLSEEFRGKASSLFEAMVTARVANQVQNIEESLISEAAELMEEFKADLTEKVDSYLSYVIEKWVEDNALAVENGLRTDIAESFINGMKNLFAEHYIDVPEEKYDVLGEMQAQLEEVSAKLDEAIAANVELHNNNVDLMKEGVFAVVAEDLAKTDAEKFKSLVADVEFENAGIFEEKLNVIKENYFPASKSTIVEDKLEDEGVEVLDESTVSKYVQALDKIAAQK